MRPVVEPVLFILIMAYTIWLASVVSNPHRRKMQLKKYLEDTPGYNAYSRIYTLRFLIVWIIFALSFGADVLFNLFSIGVGLSSRAYGLVSLLVASLAGLLLLWGLFSRRR